MIYETKKNALEHHGIRGQKWYVRRFQNKDGSLTAAGRKRYPLIKQSTSNTRSESINESIKSGKIRVNNLEDYEVGSLTEFTNSGRRFISALTNGHDFDWQEVITSPDGNEYEPVASAAKYLLDKYGTRVGKYMMADGDPVYERSVDHGRVDDYFMDQCNPTFGSPGTTQNCAKCSAVLELASRGFNFMAGRQTYPSSVDAQSFWFKDAERLHMDTDITEDSIKSFGKKTSGTLSIQYPNNAGGHAMHWTVDDQGSFEIQDGQNGKRFSSLSSMMSTYGADISKGLDVFRLDNCEPDWDHLASDSVVRDPDGEGASFNRVVNKFSGRMVNTW